jgi:hypothetical protein
VIGGDQRGCLMLRASADGVLDKLDRDTHKSCAVVANVTKPKSKNDKFSENLAKRARGIDLRESSSRVQPGDEAV